MRCLASGKAEIIQMVEHSRLRAGVTVCRCPRAICAMAKRAAILAECARGENRSGRHGKMDACRAVSREGQTKPPAPKAPNRRFRVYRRGRAAAPVFAPQISPEN